VAVVAVVLILRKLEDEIQANRSPAAVVIPTTVMLPIEIGIEANPIEFSFVPKGLTVFSPLSTI